MQSGFLFPLTFLHFYIKLTQKLQNKTSSFNLKTPTGIYTGKEKKKQTKL